MEVLKQLREAETQARGEAVELHRKISKMSIDDEQMLHDLLILHQKVMATQMLNEVNELIVNSENNEKGKPSQSTNKPTKKGNKGTGR